MKIKSIKVVKTALAQPLSPEKSKEWAGRGQFSSDYAEEKFPKGGKTEHKTILQETGAAELFGDNVPKLRKFYMPKLSNIVIIDGKEYFLTHVEKSTKKFDGFFEILGPITRNQDKTIDWEATPSYPKKVSYNQFKDEIKRSPQEVNEKIAKINKFIEEHNKMVDKQGKKQANITNLPLQIDRAERMLKDRIKEIDEMNKNVQKSSDKNKDRGQKAISDLSSLREDVMSGKVKATPQDYAVSVLETKFHNTNTLKDLKKELSTIKPPFDEKTNGIIIRYLDAVVDWQIKEREEEAKAKALEAEQRQERKESDLPEMKEALLKKIRTIEKLPSGEYDKASGYFGPEFTATQAHEIDTSQTTDYNELSSVLNSLTRSRQTIIDLPKKDLSYLRGEGEGKLGQIQGFIDDAKMFIKRYKENVFVESKDNPEELEINTKLFSKTTTGLGNALIAVVLNQIINAVQEELSRIGALELRDTTKNNPNEVPPNETAKKPTAPTEKTSGNKIDIKRMSELLWVPFQNRMNLK